MKFKLDENLGQRGVDLFREAGYDTATVAEERLCSATDRELLEHCQKEKRCLVTLDLDFGNPIIFNPKEYFGIAVIRLPSKPTPNDLYDTIRTMIKGLAQKNLQGSLWIVQKGRIREYLPEE
ncbi:MAG: DUF5615 family PIN-like protein [Thermodesulfobacteriota bacterium]